VKHDGCDCNDDDGCYNAGGAEDGSGYEDSFSNFTDIVIVVMMVIKMVMMVVVIIIV
jgi:hypothetical protein